MKKVVIYDRDYNNVTDEFKNNRIKNIEKIASDANIVITGRYLDYDRYNKGKELEQLIRDVKDGKIETVIVNSLDRLSRDFTTTNEILNVFKYGSVQCLFADRGLKSLSAQEKTLMEIVAQLEKRTIQKYSRFSKNNRKGIDEVFNKIQNKKIKLGNLLAYKNKECVVLNTGENLGNEYENFSDEQLETLFIPKKIEKTEDNKYDIIVEFAREKDKDLFNNILYTYAEYYEEELE